MIFSVTEIENFLRCERRWGLSSENTLNLEPIMNAPYLSLGTLVQAALSEWTENPIIDPVTTYQQLYVTHLDKVAKQYELHHGFPVSDTELDPLYEQILLGEHMVANYAAYYKTPLPPSYSPVRTEQRAIVPIPNTDHIECTIHGLNNLVMVSSSSHTYACTSCAASPEKGMATGIINHQLRGTFDTLVQDNKGKLWILERKTYNQRPKDEILMHNHQQLGYIWIMRQLLKIGGRDPNLIAGVLYDGLWKRDVDSGRSGKRQLEELFYRQYFPRPIAEIQEFEDQLPRVINRMAEASTLNINQLTINRRWESCNWDCSLERLCSAMSRGEDSDYIKEEFYTTRTQLTPELEEV